MFEGLHEVVKIFWESLGHIRQASKNKKILKYSGRKKNLDFFFLTINDIQEVFARLLTGILRLNWCCNGWSGPKTGSYVETTWSRHAKALFKSEID
jgi:hypothetical protein